jgi:hypothetical protein
MSENEKHRFFRDAPLSIEARNKMVDRLRMVARRIAEAPFIPDAIWSKPLHMRHQTRACRYLTPAGKVDVIPGDDEPVDYNERSEAQDAQLYRWWRHSATADATWFASAIVWAADNEPEFFEPRDLDAIEDEVLDLVGQEVDDPNLENVRKAVFKWLRSRGQMVEPTAELERFAPYLAEHGTPFKASTAWRTRALVIGVDEIAAECRRTPAGTLRLIEGGKLPVSTIAGQPCSTQDLLRPHRRHGVTAITTLAA